MRTHVSIILSLGWLLAGCGVEAYERRLSETSAYFEYHLMLNRTLAPQPWRGIEPASGVSMRIPLGFNQLPPPPPPEIDEAGNLIQWYPDDRQPRYLGIELPGIVDAWEGQTPAGVVRLYVLGNYEQLLQQGANADAVDPSLFFDDLELRLQQGFSVSFPSVERASPTADNQRYSARFPTIENYQVIKDFDVINIAPSRPIEGVEWRAQLYEVHPSRTGPVRVAVLCIFPAEERANIVPRLELALETMSVSDQPPRRPDDPRGGAGTGAF